MYVIPRSTAGLAFLLMLFLCPMLSDSCLPNHNEYQKWEKTLRRELKQMPGTFAVAFLDLQDSTRQILINERVMFHAASTMKTPVLYELYKQAEQHLFTMDDAIPVKNNFFSIVDSSVYSLDTTADSDDKLYEQIGDSASIYNLAYAMITRSSNLATNILIDLVDARKVTSSMRELGADSIMVLRGVEDLKAFEAGLSNQTTALDLMILFAALGREQLVSPEASQEMTGILLDQYYRDIIPARLPDSVKIAHKTGSITRVMHDSGLIILPDGRKYVLVLLSKDWEDETSAREWMSDLSFRIYKKMVASI